jgi:VanZ family protein
MGGVERRANPPQPFTALARRAAWPLAWLAVGYTLFLVYYTHHPRPPLPAGAAAAGDKTLHFLAYGALAGFTGLAVAARGGWTWRVAARLVAFLAAFAVVDEATQPLFSRHADPLDWGFDCIGLTVGAAVVTAGVAVVRWWRKRHAQAA